jgi:hypothetical protein
MDFVSRLCVLTGLVEKKNKFRKIIDKVGTEVLQDTSLLARKLLVGCKRSFTSEHRDGIERGKHKTLKRGL